MMVAVAILVLLAVLVVNRFAFLPSNQTKPQSTQLLQTIDECVGIADKSVAHMSVVVAFQALEIAGRKVRVLQNCMNDRAYIENPAWVKYAEPIAQKNATLSQVSFNEAYENFRREAMLVTTTLTDRPVYWVPATTKVVSP